ncbi:MAG: sugar phosphate isomerase/epimerase family protein [Opitutales bacterium]
MKSQLHPGLVSITFRQLSAGEVVDLARQAGLAGIEWGGDVHVPHGDLNSAREVAQRTADAGLNTSAYGSYYRGPQSEKNGPPFETVLETAVALDAPMIRVWPGHLGSAEAAQEGMRPAIVKQLHRVCELAAEAKIGIGLEFHQNTLTDTNASAAELVREIDHPNLTLFWQPINGAAAQHCLEGLHRLLPHISNLHVFHWTFDADGQRTVHPLADGTSAWSQYLAEVRTHGGDRTRSASLEFVRDNDPQQFLLDAATLKTWLSHA